MEKFEYIKKISWRDKTPYFYPPLHYLQKLEKISFNALNPSIKIENKEVNIYFHFPLCSHICPFCTYSTCSLLELEKNWGNRFKLKKFKEDYNKLLLQELQLWIKLIQDKNQSDIKVLSIYIGGGTPSLWFWTSQELKNFVDGLFKVVKKNYIKDIVNLQKLLVVALF